MATIEVNASSTVCRRCGTAYGRLKGNFPTSYANLYKGTGYLPYCRACIDDMFGKYFASCNDERLSVRQMCRKLDLYWNEEEFEYVEKKNTARTIMTSYLQRIAGIKYSGKSYDDTLIEEDSLWSSNSENRVQSICGDNIAEVSVGPDVIDFWGEDYSPDFLRRLDKRYTKWTKDQGDLDPGAVSLFKHICILEETIAVDSAAGRPVDKNLNTLNTLIGSLNMKPVQKKEDAAGSNVDNAPMGVWIRRFENERPVPEPDPELSDVDKIIRYIQVFFLGHLAKMLGKTTVYSKMYDDEIRRLRVESPDMSVEFDADEDFFEHRFSVSEDGVDE